MKTSKHTKSNQTRLENFNRIKFVTNGLRGGSNSSPQNSGSIMAVINNSEPIINRLTGYMSNTGSYSNTETVRGEENVLILLDRITNEELLKFRFMEITETKPAYFGGQKATSWNWVSFDKKEDVINLIGRNKLKLA